jgi:hypothetical protein
MVLALIATGIPMYFIWRKRALQPEPVVEFKAQS